MVDLLKRMILNVQQLDIHLKQYCMERGANREWCDGATTNVADYLNELKYNASNFAKQKIDDNVEI